MACWCEDKTEPWPIPLDQCGNEATANFCHDCGRDLRLPVARVYRMNEVPECLAEGQWWHVGWPSPGRRPDRVERNGALLICGAYVLNVDVADSDFKLFGPVTVSPREVPDA